MENPLRRGFLSLADDLRDAEFAQVIPVHCNSAGRGHRIAARVAVMPATTEDDETAQDHRGHQPSSRRAMVPS